MVPVPTKATVRANVTAYLRRSSDDVVTENRNGGSMDLELTRMPESSGANPWRISFLKYNLAWKQESKEFRQ